MRHALPLIAATLLLTACGADRKDEGAGRAQGQILPGSASDAMLPLDTVRSQAPLAPKAEGSAKAGGAEGEASSAASDSPAEAAPAPAAEAAAAPDEG